MGLRIIFGRAGSGKSHFCMEEIRSRLNDGAGKPLILLVPEQFSLQAERDLARRLDGGSSVRAEVLSFRRLAYRVFNEVGGVTHRHINSAGKSMLIHKVLEEIRGELKVFSKAARQRGFINTLSDLIAELKRYNVTPELLKLIEGGIEDPPLREKLLELGTIYGEFEKNLHKSYIDSDDHLTILAEKLDFSRYYDGAEIWIDEFTGFTPQEYSVIQKLLQKTSRINISLCTDCLLDEQSDETDVFFPVKNTVKKLMTLARENGIAIETPVAMDGEPYRFRDSEEIRYLEGNFYSFPYRPYRERTEDISIFSSANIYSEAEDTARDIIRLCRENGIRYRDIAVVTRDLDTYEKLIQVIFTQYGIPHFIDRKKSITDHPLIIMVICALEIFTGNWSYEPIFRYLKTGLANVDREDIDLIENYVLAWGIRGSKWTQELDWEFRHQPAHYDQNDKQSEDETLNRINDIRKTIRTPLLNLRSKIKGRKTAKDICSALYEFLCEINVPERIQNLIETFRESGELGLANEYGQIWNILIEVFDQIVEVMGEEEIGIERFIPMLAIGFEQYQTGLIPPALDQVLVGTVDRSKSHEVSALYILGVNDGVFPAFGGDEGILSDRDRLLLRSKGLEIAQDTRAKTFEEQYLVYTALTTAGKYLRLSFPIADHEGRTLRPSTIISRMKRLFPNIHETSNIVMGNADEEVLSRITVPNPTFNQLVGAIRGQVDGYNTSPLWGDVYKWYVKKEEWKRKCDSVLAGIDYTNQVPSIRKEKVRKLYGSPLYSTVSRLEKYASCPFSYCVQYGLRARERRISRLEAPDIGTFMHGVIDRFSKSLAKENMNWRTMEREWCSNEVSRIVDEMVQEMSGAILRSTERYLYLSERFKRIITRAVWLIAEHIRRSGFDPLGYEVAFGENEKFPPIIIKLPSGDEVRLVGRIDRVDTMNMEEGTYVRIIDYKSGRKAFKLSDIYYGLDIQLIAYMDALWEGGIQDLSDPILPGGILYFRIDDPIIKGRRDITEEEIEQAIMKELKMRGLLLADVKVIKEMDRDIDGYSTIIPARINKGDTLGKSSAATIKQFQHLRTHVRKLLMELGEEILNGNAPIRPYKDKKLKSCTYCSYSSICKFDPSLQDNEYRIIQDMKDEQIWQLFELGDISQGKG